MPSLTGLSGLSGLEFCGGSVFDPSLISGLTVWLESDHDVLTGGIPSTNGDQVSSWLDQSGNNNTALQATSAKQPIFHTNIQNGKPGILFDGIQQYLATAAFTSAITQPTTIFLVFSDITDSGVRPILDGATHRQQIGARDSSGFGFLNAGTNLETAYSFAAAPHVVSAIVDGNSSALWVDSISKASGAAGAATLDRAVFFTDSVAGGTDYSDGYLFEVLIYEGALSNSDRHNVENYLLNKYAIHIPHGSMIQLEDGACFLLEDGSKLLLE